MFSDPAFCSGCTFDTVKFWLLGCFATYMFKINSVEPHKIIFRILAPFSEITGYQHN